MSAIALAVEGAVGLPRWPAPKRSTMASKIGGARLLELAGDGVGVDHHRAPRLASSAETVEFPAPIPPVSPTSSTAVEGSINRAPARSGSSSPQLRP